LNKPFYQEDDFEDEAYNGGMTYGRGHRQMVNPNPNREGDFLFLIIIGEEITQVLMNI